MPRSSAAAAPPKKHKFTVPQLLAWLRMAATFRNEMLLAGGNDNTGAIHSATRLVELLALRLRYPGVSHINNLRHSPDAGSALPRGTLTGVGSPCRWSTCCRCAPSPSW